MSPEDDLQEESLRLHAQLILGDPTAPARLAELHIPRLIHHLARRQSRDEHDPLITTAAHDAFLNYIDRPAQYNSDKLPLGRYLLMSANNDFINALNAIKSEIKEPGQFVELDALPAEQEIGVVRGPSVEDQVLLHASSVWNILATHVTDPVDRELVTLMLENERRTHEYSVVLGITDLPSDEQAHQVKRHKDRLKKQLQRHIRRTDLDLYE